MSKSVNIDVPCAHYFLSGLPPGVQPTQNATIHFVAVPSEALAEVQEVLKKYQPEMDKFNELLKKAVNDSSPKRNTPN